MQVREWRVCLLGEVIFVMCYADPRHLDLEIVKRLDFEILYRRRRCVICGENL